jgi:UDP:flavonoid glycosyltransferase YjiC (YdhE family)
MEAGLRIGRRQLNATRARVGLPPTDRLHGGLSDELCLVATLPALEYPRSWREHVHVVGPLLWEPPAPAAAPPPGAAPLVVIAPSTSKDPSHRLLRSSLAGLRDLDVRVLASLDRRPLPQPVNAGRAVRLVNWMSYEQAMSDASLVICHGGHGTVVRALAAGVPVLALPHGGDMAENAVRLVWSGAGMRLPWAALHPLTLRASARRALALMPELTARTAEMAAWAAAHDGPTRAATLIERLAG